MGPPLPRASSFIGSAAGSVPLPGVNNLPIVRVGALAPSVTTRTDLGTVNTSPKDYRRGTIVSFIHLVPNLDANARFGDQITHAKAVGTICAKVRYGIVISILPFHLLVLPILSSDTNGLEHKPVEFRKECIPIVQKASEKYQLPGMNQITLWPNEDIRFKIKLNSYVVVTKPYVVEYAQPIGRYGSLRKESLEYLEKQYRIAHLRGFAAVNNDRWQDHIEAHWHQISANLQSSIDGALRGMPKAGPKTDDDGFEEVSNVKKTTLQPERRMFKI